MKKTLLFATAFSMVTYSYSQTTETTTPPKKWKLGSVQASSGLFFDNFQTMNLNQMMDYASNPQGMEDLVKGMEGSYFTSIMGVSMKGEMGLQPFNFSKNERNTMQELILGGQINMGKEAMISYRSETDLGNDTVMTKDIILCDLENEFVANIGYRFKAPLLKYFRIATGVNTNIGTTFGDKFLTITSESRGVKTENEWGEYVEYVDSPENTNTTQEQRAKASLFGRVYIPLRISIPFLDCIEFSGTLQTGVGFQKVYKGNTYFLNNTTAAYMGVSWLF